MGTLPIRPVEADVACLQNAAFGKDDRGSIDCSKSIVAVIIVKHATYQEVSRDA